jgi:hypothetical protein
MAPYVYTDRISSGVNRFTDERTLKLTPKQQAAYDAVEQAFQKVRTSRRSGRVDVEAARHLAPEAFDGKPEAEHQAIADHLASNGLGGRMQHVRGKIVNGSTTSTTPRCRRSAKTSARPDKPHVIFAHNYGSPSSISSGCARSWG